MSYITRLTGRISIDPPLTYADLAKLPCEWWVTLKMLTNRDEQRTDTGVLTVITGEGIGPVSSEVYNERAEDELSALVRAFPDRTFTGHLEGSGEEPGDIWRLVVRDGTVHRLEPKWEI